MLRHFTGCAGLAALLFPSPAHAHHPSGVASTGDGGPVATISAGTLDQGHSTSAVFFEMVRIDAFSDAQLKTFAGQHIHAHSLDAILAPTLVYAYGVTNDLTLIGRLPYVARRDIREGHHSHGAVGNTVNERGDADGFGDLTLLGQSRIFNSRETRTEAALLLGVKAPTGRTGLHDNLGERFEAEFQSGTGSWDGLFGAAFTQRFGAWAFDSNVLYQLATKGALDTDLGDRFLYNFAVSYRFGGAPPRDRPMHLGALPEPIYHGGSKGGWHSHSHLEPTEPTSGPALDLVLELNGEWHGHQAIAGVRDENSGGNVVYLSPGLRVSFDKWSCFASVGIPVVNHVNGPQAEPEWRLLTGIAVSF